MIPRLKGMIVSCSVSLFLCFSVAALAATNNVLSANIKEADGITDQDTNAGSGVKTGHIQDAAVTESKIADGAVTSSKILRIPLIDLVWTAGYFNGMGGGSPYKWLFGALPGAFPFSPAVYLLTTDGTFVLPDAASLVGQHDDWHFYAVQDEVGGHGVSFVSPPGGMVWETSSWYSTTAGTVTHFEFHPIQFCAAYDRTQLLGPCIDWRSIWMASVVSTGVAY